MDRRTSSTGIVVPSLRLIYWAMKANIGYREVGIDENSAGRFVAGTAAKGRAAVSAKAVAEAVASAEALFACC